MVKAALVLMVGMLPLWGQVRNASDISQTTSLPDHKIAPEDLIGVFVFDEPQLSKNVRVGKDGTIVMPVLGVMHVQGLLPREFEAEMKRQLTESQILIHPSVAVTLMEYASRMVSVVGDVKNPGQFPITQPITLMEALAKAGWATSDAGSLILLTREGSETPQKIDILQLQSDQKLNVLLNGGEVVDVPEAPKVWVTGNVTKPQAVPVKNPADASVLKVLSVAEGLTQYYGKIAYIYRIDAGAKNGRQEIPIPLKDMMHRKKPDVPLFADDILLIPDDNGVKRRAILQTLASFGSTATSAAILYATR